MPGAAAPVLWCLFSAALFGASTPAAKALLTGVGPLALAGLLYLGAAAAVLPFARRSPDVPADRRRRSRLLVAGAVAFGGGAGPVLLLLGLRLAPAASVALWLNLETVATALLGAILFREHLGGRVWLAAGLAVIGGAVLAAPAGLGGLAAAGLVAGACLCWGLDNHFTSLVDGLTPARVTLAKGLFAGTVNLGLAFALGAPAPRPAAAAAALAVGALGYGVSIVLYVRGAQALGATRSQVLFSTAPFLGTMLAWCALGERVEAAQAAGAVPMAVAVLLLLSSRHAHPHRHAPVIHVHRHRHDDGHHGHPHAEAGPGSWHTHEHAHAEESHAHAHAPDLHHRHGHGAE